MDALILVAHADDETLGCGGIIQKLTKTKWSVNVVVLSNGIVDARGKLDDNREDLKTACKLLGVSKLRQLDFSDQKFDNVPMADLANAVVRLNLSPDLIITHVDSDLNM